MRSLAIHGSPAGYAHWCPGCGTAHIIYVQQGKVRWSFNGDVHQPAFDPSVRIFATLDDGDRTLCHYFIRRGDKEKCRDPALSYIEYCEDSAHSLRGRTVLLPDWPEKEWAGLDDATG